jgi:hypothetical protein
MAQLWGGPPRNELERYKNVVNLLILTSLAFAVMFALSLFSVHSDPISIEYKDLIALILTALGIMLACVTLLIGAMAIVGWASFQERVRTGVREEFKAATGKDGDLRPFLAEELAKVVLEQGDSKQSEEFLAEGKETENDDG